MVELASVLPSLLAQSLPFSATIKFNRLSTIYAQPNVTPTSQPVTFAVDFAEAIPGAVTVVRIASNGSNAPIFGTIKQLDGSGWKNVSGTLNVLQFVYLGGTEVWVTVTQEFDANTLQFGTMATQSSSNVNITGGTASLDSINTFGNTTVTGLSYSQSSDIVGVPATVSSMTDGLLSVAAWTNAGGTQWIEASFTVTDIVGVTLGAAVGDYLPPGFGPFTQYLNLCKLQYWNGSIWIDLTNISGIIAGQIKTFNWPSVRTSKIRLTGTQFVGTVEFSVIAQRGVKILPAGIQINNEAIQTASIRGSKTITTPSTTDTITVTGATIGDIVRTSRGKDAFVSAANTITFDSSGLAGVVVSVIVERFV